MDESRIALLPLDCDNAVEKGSRAIVSIRSKTGLETNAVREQVSEGAERVGSAVCDLEKSKVHLFTVRDLRRPAKCHRSNHNE